MFKRRSLGILLLLIMIAGITAITTVNAADPELRINPGDRFQTIDGFGASIAYMQGELFKMKEPYRSQCADLLFKDLGATILRLRVDNTTEFAKDEFTFNKDSAQVWTAQQAMKRGIQKIIASTWSAPAWMKDNNQLMDGGHIKPENYDAVAKWYAVYLKQYREKFGVPIDYISLTNEPDLATSYDSMLVTPEEYGKLARTIDARLKADGIPTKLFGPETMGSADAVGKYAPFILGADSPMGMFGTHTYAANDLPGLAEIGPKYHIPVWVTEYAKLQKDREKGIDESLTIANHINTALTVGNVNAFLYWGYWWDETSPQGLILASAFDSYFETTKRYFMFKQFAKFIRPGAVRIGIDAGSTGLGVSAYENGANLTVLIINKSAAECKMNLVLPGDATLTVYETSDAKDCEQTGKVLVKNGQPTPVVIPANAIITLTGNWKYDKSAVKATDKTSTSAKTETPATDKPGKILPVTGFEDTAENTSGIGTYNGPKSEVKTEIVSDIVHEGKYAIKISYQCADWIGVLWNLTPKTGDWTGMTAVSYWIYSDGTKVTFNPVLEDAQMEQFMLSSPITINWTGWHQVIVPISQFRSRTDYQPKEGKINGTIDYPARNFHFMANIGGKGTLYVDQIEAIGN